MDHFVFRQQYGTEVPGNEYDDPTLCQQFQCTLCVTVCSVHVHGMCVFFFSFPYRIQYC